MMSIDDMYDGGSDATSLAAPLEKSNHILMLRVAAQQAEDKPDHGFRFTLTCTTFADVLSGPE
jgi:hypothetical protein